ncbi:MAG: hypothetical protein GY839_08205, partial [candidate division Zixibacteria bacterium]|nr:hypothetical protein [candidate division Zixibacteria bacterium]
YTFTFDESGTIIDVRGKVIPDAAGAAEPGKAISKEKALDTVIPIIEDNGLEIVDEKASYLAVIKIHEKYYKAWVFYLVTDTKPKSIPSLWVVRAVNGKLMVAEERFIDTDQYDLVDMTPIDKIYDYAKTHKETGFIYPEHELIQRGFKKHTYCTGGVTELFDVAFEGVRIHKAKVRVKLNMDGDVIQFKGSMDPQIRLIDTEPSISADQAEKLIYSKHENYDKKNVELAIIKHQDKYYLTWIVRRLGLIYQVDAHSGDVLEKHSSHHH